MGACDIEIKRFAQDHVSSGQIRFWNHPSRLPQFRPAMFVFGESLAVRPEDHEHTSGYPFGLTLQTTILELDPHPLVSAL